MNVRFISSMTPEDEDRIVPLLLKALTMLLDQFPLAYTLRIETSSERVFQHSHSGDDRGNGPIDEAAISQSLPSQLPRA